MVVGIKDGAKLIGIFIIACCAVLVCTLFMNYNIDILQIQDEITPAQIPFYEAQKSTGKVVCAVSGGCLLLTSVILLLFYIRHYIDTHKKTLGILKALGYSDFQIAKHFWVFGLSVFGGAFFGFCGAFLMIPAFYNVQNRDHLLPEIPIHFHWSLFLYLVLLPAMVFAVLAICYADLKLKKPVLQLIMDHVDAKTPRKTTPQDKDIPFLSYLKKQTLKSKKTLAFFIVFASFCFSAMTQMSFSMQELSSEMMGIMIMLIGLVLACTTLFLAGTTVIDGNSKTIALMRAFGYSHQQCYRSLLGCYRPLSYIGFAVGTFYQYALLKIMVDIVFKDVAEVPEYEFDFPAMLVSLAAFVVFYEAVMYFYSTRIRKISIKEIMLA